jgi:hypothetical protein
MTLISIHDATRHAEGLIKIFDEIKVDREEQSGVDRGVMSLREILQELANPGDPNDPMVIQRHVAGAGVHDLSAKICAVWDKLPAKRQLITPHLKLLAETYYVGQNEANPRWDRIGGVPREHGDADKVVELYWGCLCLLAGLDVELDDPVESSQGRNPDVIAVASDKTVWSFALKTLSRSENAANVPKNLLANIQKGMKQIAASRASKGFVVVNAKNIVDHDSLRRQGPYHTWQEANARLSQQLQVVLDAFYRDEVMGIEQTFNTGGVLAPIFVVVAHSAVLGYPPDSHRPVWTEVRTMIAPNLPKPDLPSAGSFGAEALGFAADLNHLMQTVT